METPNQDRDQNGFENRTIGNNTIKKKKKSLKEIQQETKAMWTKFKLSVKNFVRISKKIFHFIMVIYVIISAIITFEVSQNPLNYLYTYQNPEKVEILRDADPQGIEEMINSYLRIDERTEKQRKDEFEKEFEKVSGTNNLSIVETAQAASPVETTESNEAGIVRKVTAYNLMSGQTDDSPCVGAANQNLCYLMRVKKMNVCAAPLSYAFGTIVKIPGYTGSQKNGDDTCVVLDRMADKHPEGIDICMDQDLTRAKNFGGQPINITIVGYVENWNKLAPVEKFPEPSR